MSATGDQSTDDRCVVALDCKMERRSQSPAPCIYVFIKCLFVSTRVDLQRALDKAFQLVVYKDV
jgi:hypothetical protein